MTAAEKLWLAALGSSLSLVALARAIETGTVAAFLNQAANQARQTAALTVAPLQQTIEQAFAPLRAAIQQGVKKNVDYFTRYLPKAGKVNGTVVVQFDVLNPRIIDAVRELDTRIVKSLADDTRAGIMTAVEQGLRDGKHPRDIAKQIKASVGITPKQEQNAQKYEAKLRDAGNLTESQIEKRVAAYRKNAVQNNATVTARTAALDAMKLGQKLTWDDAIAKGIVDGDKLTKTWKGVLDERERPTHVAMQNQTVPYNSPYSNGQMIPGDTEFNCRCISIYRVA